MHICRKKINFQIFFIKFRTINVLHSVSELTFNIFCIDFIHVYFQQPIVLSYKEAFFFSKTSFHYYLVKMYYNTRGTCFFTIILTNEVTNLGAISN